MILCSISTKGRYDTTLPLAIQSVINQTRKVDKFIIYDDNNPPEDVRNRPVYQHLFNIMNEKGINWEWLFAEKKGQHYNHQNANMREYEWVWRMDDDTVAEPDVLERLYNVASFKWPHGEVGAVGGSILTPPFPKGNKATGKLDNIDREQNLQWDYINQTKEVDHLHCSFLYRAGVHDYNLSLSKVAHREETLFTYGLKQKGYLVFVTPAITWHLRNPSGGIRDGQREMFEADETIFRNIVGLGKQTLVILDCGMGDHIVFKHVLPDIKNPMIFSCYPEIIPGRSIQEAKNLFGNIEQYNVYQKMDEWNWKGSLEDAFRKFYNAPKLHRDNNGNVLTGWTGMS